MFVLFALLIFKKVFIIHGFEFRYTLMYKKLTSCIKDPQHEENNLVAVGSRGSRRDIAFSNFLEAPLSSIVLTSDGIVYGEIYPVHNWRFIFDISDDAQCL